MEKIIFSILTTIVVIATEVIKNCDGKDED